MNRKSLTILFCLIFLLESLFPRIELSELSQLPELLAHFKVHQQEVPGTTFFEFIRLHYDDNSKHISQDASGHHHLPFSKHHNSNLAKQVLYNNVALEEVPAACALLGNVDGVCYSEFHAFMLAHSVWQPPRA